MVINRTKAVAVSIQAVSPELKTGVSSARAIEGKKTTFMNIKPIIAHGFLDLWSGILVFI
jgi:hypothetical protein